MWALQKLPHKLVAQSLAPPYLLLIHFRYDSQHRSAVIDKQTNKQTDTEEQEYTNVYRYMGSWRRKNTRNGRQGPQSVLVKAAKSQ